MAPEDGLLSGTVTFLFTDIEGSTDLLKRLGRDLYGDRLGGARRVLRASVEAHGGRVVDTQGDSLFCAFRSAREAVSAAIDAQLTWPHTLARAGSGTRAHGVAQQRAENRRRGYVGIGVHRAARFGAAAHGGQVLVSETARRSSRMTFRPACRSAISAYTD